MLFASAARRNAVGQLPNLNKRLLRLRRRAKDLELDFDPGIAGGRGIVGHELRERVKRSAPSWLSIRRGGGSAGLLSSIV